MEPLSATRPGALRETRHRRPIAGTQQEKRYAREAARDFVFYAEHPDWPPDELPSYHRGKDGRSANGERG